MLFAEPAARRARSAIDCITASEPATLLGSCARRVAVLAINKMEDAQSPLGVRLIADDPLRLLTPAVQILNLLQNATLVFLAYGMRPALS